MSLTKESIQTMFAAARSVLSGAQVVLRHNRREYTGTRLPLDKAEMVDEAGAIFTIQGGMRLLTSELGPTWPKAGDQVRVKSTETGKWLTFVVISTRLDEMEATMLLQYGERYDQDGV